MKKSTTLLLVSILGLVLVAPPAYPQKTQDQLNALMTDAINLKATVKQLQDSMDQKHAETNKLLQEVLTRFTALDASMKTLNDSLNATTATMKANEDKSTRDMEATKLSLQSLQKNIDEGMVGLQGQMRTLNLRLNEMNSAEQPLATAGQLFNQAKGELDSGLYSLAVEGFRDFLKNYPNDALRSPAAQYYIGDALMAQMKYDEAIIEFDLVLSKYPTSDRRCSALYQKGRAYVESKQAANAKPVLESVVKECAGKQEAINATNDLKGLATPRRK